MQTNPHYIDVKQLRVGLYIHLDLGWMDHPFTLSNFKLHDEKQIQQIKLTGIKSLRYDPHRSDCMPLPLLQEQPILPTSNAENTMAEHMQTDALEQNPHPKQARLILLENMINESEKKFINTSSIVRNINQNILVSPKICIEQATSVVNELVDTALMEGDIVIHAMNGNRSSDAHYQHPLNVTVLALMLAKSISISKDDTRTLGLAAILHDIGKAEISDRVLLKKDHLTTSEQAHYHQHASFGARMIKEIGLPARIGRILHEHHELADGTGYPLGLKADQTDLLSQMIVLVNAYDNLCNPTNVDLAKTPYEALALMYATQRSKFNEDLLKRLIKSLGIYPPGSIVKLSNEEYATVISVNPNEPLRPYVKVHYAKSEGDSALIDLREEVNINITGCIKASQLPQQILAQIPTRKRMSFFIDRDIL